MASLRADHWPLFFARLFLASGRRIFSTVSPLSVQCLIWTTESLLLTTLLPCVRRSALQRRSTIALGAYSTTRNASGARPLCGLWRPETSSGASLLRQSFGTWALTSAFVGGRGNALGLHSGRAARASRDVASLLQPCLPCSEASSLQMPSPASGPTLVLTSPHRHCRNL